jgi:hypothetical protein
MLIRHGGQPDGNDVWSSPDANARAGDFFSATWPMLSCSAVRPRHAGWPALQKATGEALVAALAAGATPGAARGAVLSAAARISPPDFVSPRKE